MLKLSKITRLTIQRDGSAVNVSVPIDAVVEKDPQKCIPDSDFYKALDESLQEFGFAYQRLADS